MYNIVKGNQTTNSNAYKEIVKDYPHMENIIGRMFISTDYAIGNIWDSERKIVFYFYQSMGMNFHDMELLTLMNKYDVSVQVCMGDGYNFNVCIDKEPIIEKPVVEVKKQRVYKPRFINEDKLC